MTSRPDFYLHHGALAVTDLQRSIDFYREVLGFEVDTQVQTPAGDMDIVHMRRGEDYLELFCHENAEELPEFARDNASDFRVAGTKHIAFSTDEPEALHRYLQSRNAPDLTPIQENNPYYRYFFLRDPDGIAIEVVSKRAGKTPGQSK